MYEFVAWFANLCWIYLKMNDLCRKRPLTFIITCCWNKDHVAEWHHWLSETCLTLVSVDLGGLFSIVWAGWGAVSTLNSTKLWPCSLLPAIVIPGLVHLSYGRNVAVHEKRSTALMILRGFSPVLSQGSRDVDMLSHGCNVLTCINEDHSENVQAFCLKPQFLWTVSKFFPVRPTQLLW